MSVASIRRARPVAISLAGVVIVFGLLYAWKTMRSAPPGNFSMPPVPVSVVHARIQNVPDELQAVAGLQAAREVLLAPDTAGRVTAIRFEAGQTVKEGVPLVQLYDAPEQADRAAALAKARFAQLQLERSQQLAPTGAESRELLQQRQADADQAVAAVRQLDARIEQKNIRAPFAGQLGIRRINLGQYLNAGDAIVTLTQIDPLYVNFTLPQQDLPDITPGSTVQVKVDAVPGRVFAARISTIEPQINSETRNVMVQATLSNADHALRPGMYATARLSLPSTSAAAVLPLTAVQTSASGDSVMVVQQVDARGQGKVTTVPITTGRRMGDSVLVTQGVKDGDIIVTAGQNRLPPGAIVQIQPDATAANKAGTR